MMDINANQTRMKNEEDPNKGKKSSGIVQIIVAVIALAGVIGAALINAKRDIIIRKMDISETMRIEEQEEQKELEKKQHAEALTVLGKDWESHAGIEYLKYSIGTASETTQFRVRPYLFCDVTLSTGEVFHCWIRNHYTQEEYLSENGRIELMQENNQEVLESRLESLLQKKGYKDIEVESYTLLLVEYSVREVAPEYLCYCLKDGKFQIQGMEWGNDLICDKDKHSFSAECKTWEWIE